MKKVISLLVSCLVVFLFLLITPGMHTYAQTPTSCVVLTNYLQYGSRDSKTQNQVSELQAFLIDRRYYISGVTGYFGRETQQAVRRFQSDNGISVVGAVGPITRQKIKNATCMAPVSLPVLPTSGVSPTSTVSLPVSTSTPPISSTAQPGSIVTPITPVPTISPSPQPTPLPATQPGGAQYGPYSHIAFDDEFNSTTLSPVWDPHYYWWWGQKNLEFIPANISVENGMLRLTAEKDSTSLSQGTGYTKAAVNSYNGVDKPRAQGFAFQYGFVEARVRVSPGQGLWPAFWAKPLIDVNNDPEIDFFEGLKDDSKTTYDTYMTLHSPAVTQNHITTANFADGSWHIIGFEWDQNHMTWFIDGIPEKTVTGSLVVTQPMTLIFDLDIDCSKDVCWQKPTNANTPNPAYFDVDYVRVWQK